MKRNRRHKARNVTILAAVAAILMAGPLFVIATHGDQEPSLERELPATVSCGETFTVKIHIDWNGGDQLFIEETVPNGWSILDASHGGKTIDGSVPMVKWALEQDESIKTLSYTLRADTTHTGIEYLGGSFRHTDMSADEHNISFHGDNEIVVTGCASRSIHQGSTFAQTDKVECGDTLQVLLEVTPPEGSSIEASWMVDEIPPDGVDVSQVDRSNRGEYLEAMHRVKWVSLDGDGALLTYTIQVDDDHPPGPLDFNGEYRLHPSMEERGMIQGTRSVEVQCAGQDGTDPIDDNETDGLLDDNQTGDGGTSTNDSKASPPVLVQAFARDQVPAGALAAFGTNATDLESGRRLVIETDDPYVRKIEVVPSTDASMQKIEVVRWPNHHLPDGSHALPRALDTVLLYEITIGDDHQDDHEVTFHLRLDGADVDEGEPVVLVRQGQSGWNHMARIELEPTDGDHDVTVNSLCCSLFAAVIDQEAPTVTPIVPPGELSGTVLVRAEASDNLHVAKVEFLLDDELLHTATDEPYSHELDVQAHEAGTHRLTVVATDGAGLTATGHRTIRLDPAEDAAVTQTEQTPQTQGADGNDGAMPLWPVVGLVGAGALASVAYAGRSPLRSVVANRLDWDWEWRW